MDPDSICVFCSKPIVEFEIHCPCNEFNSHLACILSLTALISEGGFRCQCGARYCVYYFIQLCIVLTSAFNDFLDSMPNFFEIDRIQDRQLRHDEFERRNRYIRAIRIFETFLNCHQEQ